jgi:hypothetical protein
MALNFKENKFCNGSIYILKWLLQRYESNEEQFNILTTIALFEVKDIFMFT